MFVPELIHDNGERETLSMLDSQMLGEAMEFGSRYASFEDTFTPIEVFHIDEHGERTLAAVITETDIEFKNGFYPNS